MIPLRDNIPTGRFPVLTVLLIALNLAFFVWQLTLPSDEASSAGFAAAGVSERDEANIELGAIPHRILNPGEPCAVGIIGGTQAEPVSQVVCEGTTEFDNAAALAANQGAPLEPIDGVAWFITLFTSMFMHGGLLHFAGNMLFLWVFGNNVEDTMGRARFVAFYLLSGLVAVYAQALLNPESTIPTIGASGAVAGVLGAYLILHPRARVVSLVIVPFFVTIIEVPAMILLAAWFVLQFIPAAGQLATPELAAEGGVAYLAHVGGFLFGMAVVKLFALGRERRLPAGLAGG